MNRKMLTLGCVFLLLVGILATGAGATTPLTYQVGYAERDINPWVDPSDHSQGVLEIQMTGLGALDAGRNSVGIMDDDCDGIYGYKAGDGAEKQIDDDDGLRATCTVVTDSAGTSVMFITMDMMAAYSSVISAARTAIMDELGYGNILPENIFLSASNIYSGFKFSEEQFTSETGAFHDYYLYVIEQIKDAAITAWNDRAAATMSKGSIDVSETVGHQLNYIRHYHRNLTDTKDQLDGENWTIYDPAYSFDYVEGTNFGDVDAVREYIGEVNGLTDMDLIRERILFEGFKKEDISAAFDTTADDMMHLVQFEFTDDTKDPVLFVNWRAHAMQNASANFGYVSSDYVGPLRAFLKQANFRPAFFMGAALNLVTTSVSQDPNTTTWNTPDVATGLGIAAPVSDSHVYGKLLANAAQACIAQKMVSYPAGDIESAQLRFTPNLQVDSDLLREAADAAAEAGYTGEMPYRYEKGGEVCFINSIHHMNNIINRKNNTAESKGNITLGAVSLGGNAAFVTAPYELSDRYDLTNALIAANNDWLELNELGFGTPFVLSCTNGNGSYMPSSTEYLYNTDAYYQLTGYGKDGKEFFAPGSFEANCSPVASGSGEQMVQQFKTLLNRLSDTNAYIAECPHCGVPVQWQPIYQNTVHNGYDGHYYLAENVTATGRLIAQTGTSVCLDLNGFTYEANCAAFHPHVDATISVMDSSNGETGEVISHNSASASHSFGGTVIVGKEATFNLYGGKLRFNKNDNENVVQIGVGGVVWVGYTGVFNMYGGSIEGTDALSMDAVVDDIENVGQGAAVYLEGGALNIEDGSITSGIVPEGGRGPCVLLANGSSRIALSGNATVDQIYINSNNGAQVTVANDYAGEATLVYHNEAAYNDGTVVGTITGTGYDPVNLTLAKPAADPNATEPSNCYLWTSGTQLRISNRTKHCDACDDDVAWIPLYQNRTDTYRLETGHYYLAESFDAASAKEIYPLADQKVCLDLNGMSYENVGRAFNVASGVTLNILDTSKDKTGAVTAVPRAGYTQTSWCGGVTFVQSGGNFNIYGGTYSLKDNANVCNTGHDSSNTAACTGHGVGVGGIVYVNVDAAMHMYGGKILGAQMVMSDHPDATANRNGSAGAIYVAQNAQLQVSGGQILSGSVPNEDGTQNDGKAPCVLLAAASSKLTLSGDADVQEIYVTANDDAQLCIIGKYTGTTTVVFADEGDLIHDNVVGVSNSASFNETNVFVNRLTEDPNNTVSSGCYLWATGDTLRLANRRETCQACGEAVQWIPMFNSRVRISDWVAGPLTEHLGTGHYYYAEDLSGANHLQLSIREEEVLCLDLNGMTAIRSGRNYSLRDTGKLNIMDSSAGQTGKVISRSGDDNAGGGLLTIASQCQVNIYGGTFQFVADFTNEDAVETGSAGVAAVYGELNIYDGELIGGELVVSSWKDSTGKGPTYNGTGGAVVVFNAGKLNMEGGRITAGQAATGGVADCVFITGGGSQVKLSGDAVIDEIYVNWINYSWKSKGLEDNPQLTVAEDYSGSAKLYFDANNALKHGLVIGNVTGDGTYDNFDENILCCTNETEYDIVVAGDGDDLILSTGKIALVYAYKGDPNPVYYYDLNQAFADYDQNGYFAAGGHVVLFTDIADPVTLKGDTYVNIDGCDVDVSKITFKPGAQLYLMDSQTDGLTVENHHYGIISNYDAQSGKVLAVPEKAVNNYGYVIITETNPETAVQETSVHRFTLKLNTMTLRAHLAGVFYSGTFEGDEVVARNVVAYGVALNAYEAPTSANMLTSSRCSVYNDFKPGPAANGESTGVLLSGIMKTTNADFRNSINASAPVYGSPYLLLSNGEYVLGNLANRSLRQQVELADDYWHLWSTVQKDSMKDMYRQYSTIMQYWDIPQLIAEVASEDAA